MRASVGDRLILKGHSGAVRDAEILEVNGSDGSPPYVVRWSDDGHVGLVFPGPDATIQHFEHVGATSDEPRYAFNSGS